MKKLFILSSVLFLSLLVYAKEIRISSETSNIIYSTIASSGTADGDVIVLTDAGPYVNSKSNSDDYTKLLKNITIKADDGVVPVVKLEVPIQGRNGKSGKFIGVKFDGTNLTAYDRLVYFNDANNNGVEFENCEFYNISKYIVQVTSGTKAQTLVFRNCKFHDNTSNRGILIQGTVGHLGFYGCEFSGFAKDVINGYETTSHVDSCIVDDCYFHNHSRSSIYFKASSVDGTQTCDKLVVKNSTFANVNASGDYTSVIDIRPYGTSTTDAIKVIVDHCTFYNNTVINSDHANIRTAYLSDVTVSNCIFAYPSEYAVRATYCTGGGNINNCLTYNYTASGTKGHAYGATVNAASTTGDPIFNDLANNKYTFDGNWSTMSMSPARGAATDGSDLGDPRWYSAEILPSTSFASAYDLLPTKAKLSGRIELNASDHIRYKHTSDVTDGTAKWKLHIGKLCAIGAVAKRESGSTSGCQLTLTVKDADGNTVGTMAAVRTDDDNDINLGGMLIPEEGDYTFILTNSTASSGAILEKITLSYIGGAVQNMPATTAINEAWFSSGGTRADGKIDFPDGYIQDGWVKWNVAFASNTYCNVTVNVSSDNGHNYTVALYRNEDDDSPITVTEGGQTSAASPLDLGAMNVPAGNYILKVTNSVQYSDAQLVSVQFTSAGGGTVDIPGDIDFSEAMLSSNAYLDGDDLHFSDAAHKNHVADEFARWNIHADAGVYKFTYSVNGTDYGIYKLTIFDDEDNEVYVASKGISNSGSYTTAAVYLDGDYVLQMQNVNNYSVGYLTALSAAAVAGVVTLNENAENTDVLTANKDVSKTIRLIRTVKGGMYNTICLPFGIGSTKLKAAFGDDVQVMEMTAATIDGSVLDLSFEDVTSSGIYQGTPYLIKTSKDVANPVFEAVTITVTEGDITTGNRANFIGNVISGTITASPDNLFLGANDKLYFPTGDTPIKGMRAYFHVHDAPAGVITRARIVQSGNVVTEVELIDGELRFSDNAPEATRKIIENGQVIIIRDGIRYNAIGIRLSE